MSDHIQPPKVISTKAGNPKMLLDQGEQFPCQPHEGASAMVLEGTYMWNIYENHQNKQAWTSFLRNKWYSFQWNTCQARQWQCLSVLSQALFQALQMYQIILSSQNQQGTAIIITLTLQMKKQGQHRFTIYIEYSIKANYSGIKIKDWCITYNNFLKPSGLNQESSIFLYKRPDSKYFRHGGGHIVFVATTQLTHSMSTKRAMGNTETSKCGRTPNFTNGQWNLNFI